MTHPAEAIVGMSESPTRLIGALVPWRGTYILRFSRWDTNGIQRDVTIELCPQDTALCCKAMEHLDSFAHENDPRPDQKTG